MSRPARLRDVAAEAGVSLGTVSNVLNDPDRVRPETRERVYQAMRALGYTRRGITFAVDASAATARRTARAGLPLLVSAGYLSVDIVARVPVMPHRSDRITAERISKHLGGSAAGVAVAAAALGPPFELDVELATAIGDDADSRWALDLLTRRGVRASVVRNPEMNRLSRCIVIVEASGHRTRINEPLRITGAELVPRLPSCAEERRRHLHVEGYQVPLMLPQFGGLRQDGWTISASDTGLPHALLAADDFAGLLAALDILVLNRRTASRILGGDMLPTEDLIGAMRRLLDIQASRAEVAVTLGVEGAAVFPARREAAPVRAAARPVEIVDGTGAGDCFTGAYIGQRLHDEPPGAAAARACVAASLAMTAEGAQGRRTTAREIEAGLLVGSA